MLEEITIIFKLLPVLIILFQLYYLWDNFGESFGFKSESDKTLSATNAPDEPAKQMSMQKLKLPLTNRIESYIQPDNNHNYSIRQVAVMLQKISDYYLRFTPELVSKVIASEFPVERHDKLKQQFKSLAQSSIHEVNHSYVQHYLPYDFIEQPFNDTVLSTLFAAALVLEAQNPHDETMDKHIKRIESNYIEVIYDAALLIYDLNT